MAASCRRRVRRRTPRANNPSECSRGSGPYSIAAVSLDLSALLRFARRWPELEELAADTYRRFRELGEDEEALAALKLWLDAAQARTLSEELIAEVKATVEGRRTGPAAAAAGRR